MSQPPTYEELVNLSAELGRSLSQQGLTICTAESCTGGLVASILTDVAGSSAYVLGGVVSYTNEAKMQLLDVRESTLIAHGAVSAETAAEMAAGARRLFGSDLAVSITGIAGPGGGTEEKPVGLVYLHFSAEDATWGERWVWPFDRQGNKLASARAALMLARRYVQEKGAGAGKRERRQEAVAPRAVVVEARWQQGSWRPQAVWLGEKRRQIVGWGRQEESGAGRTEIMVETEDGARMALEVDVKRGQWRLLRGWWPRRAV